MSMSTGANPLSDDAAKALLDGIPASILVAPDAAQARLPYDIVWD